MVMHPFIKLFTIDWYFFGDDNFLRVFVAKYVFALVFD